MSKSRVAAIGAGVGVAAASVITLLVVKGDKEPTEESATPIAFTPPQLPKTLPAGPVKPSPAPADKRDATVPTDAKAEADKAKADQAKADADAKKARQDAIQKARDAGVLGKQQLQQGGTFASLTGTGKSGFDDTNIYGGLLGNEAGEMNGGFGYGRSGFGPGGGGTGWGTIGTGRYGTIGKGTGGSGYGSGRGGMRGRSSVVPTISLGQPTVTPAVASAADPGNLDKAIVRRYVKRNIQKLQYCYEKELLAKSDLKGTVNVTFAIEETGLVSNASASGVDPNVSSCITGVISGIEFPKPKGTGGVRVGYAFTFRPAGE